MKKLDLTIREIVIFVFFLIGITSLFSTLIIHHKFLSSDPLIFGLEVHGYTGCVCYKEDPYNNYGFTCFQEDGGFKCKSNKPQEKKIEMNYDELFEILDKNIIKQEVDNVTN